MFYVNRFAIVWIPLTILLIFNTILITYVSHSERIKRTTNDNFQLRRHSRAKHNEQRKTTNMLSKLNKGKY